MRSRTALLAVVALLATGCTSHPKPKPDPGAEQAAARARLAALARATADGTYDATYDFEFVEAAKPATGRIRIRQRPPDYRIDVIGAKDTASFFALENRIVSCTQKAKTKKCFLVARPGEEVPAVFDPGVQHLFRDAVSDLAAHPETYDVRSVPPPTATATPAPVPAGECFEVHRPETPGPDPVNGFEDGTYCFAEQGVATRIEVASGTLALAAYQPTVDDKAFEPIAKVATLPSLTPTPTPKK